MDSPKRISLFLTALSLAGALWTKRQQIIGAVNTVLFLMAGALSAAAYLILKRIKTG